MPSSDRLRRPPLWLLLAFLGVMAALPFLVFAMWTSSRLAADAARTSVERAQLTAKAVAHGLDRELSGLLSTVRAMSLSPALKRDDLRAFDSYMREVAAGLNLHLVLRDRTGRQILSTRLPYGSELPVSLTGFDARAFEKPQPYVSSIVFGAVSKTPLFLALAQIVDDGAVKYILNLSIPVERIGEVIRETPGSDDIVISVIGQDGRIIHRTRDNARFLGQPAPVDLLQAISGRREGAWRGMGSEPAALVSYYTVGDTGWTVTAAVAAEVLQRPWQEEVLRLGVAGILALIASAGLACLVGGAVFAGIKALVRSAQTIHLDAPRSVEEPIWVREFDILKEALREASIEIAAARETQKTLLREMRHRIRNILTVVISVCRMSFRNSTDLKSYFDDLNGRLEALANTSEIITNRGDSAATMREVIESELRPFETSRISMSGDNLVLSAEQATYISLMIHELATNALKYGALSDERGTVSISWKIDTQVPAHIAFEWTEQMHRPCEPSGREGFGSTLLKRVLSLQLRANVEMDFRPTGLHYTARFPARWRNAQSEQGD